MKFPEPGESWRQCRGFAPGDGGVVEEGLPPPDEAVEAGLLAQLEQASGASDAGEHHRREAAEMAPEVVGGVLAVRRFEHGPVRVFGQT